MRFPSGKGSAGGPGLITCWDSRDQDRFLQAAKTKEEIIWEGARLLLFPDLTPITQGKREELTVVKGGRQGERKKVREKNVSAPFSPGCQNSF